MFRRNRKKRVPRLNPRHELAVLLPVRTAGAATSRPGQKFDRCF
jgi:hypothetical protein